MRDEHSGYVLLAERSAGRQKQHIIFDKGSAKGLSAVQVFDFVSVNQERRCDIDEFNPNSLQPS